MSLVIVGNGMVGARLCAFLAQQGVPAQRRVVVLGEEALPGYDRVHLSDLFTNGKTAEDLLLEPARWYAEAGIELRSKERVVRIDRDARRIATASGAELDYETLVLATGSKPVVPEGVELDSPRIQVYRSVEDREAIDRHARPGARVAILGAGLLGIELAEAMKRRGAHVVLLERAPRLLPRHLESSAAEVLSAAVSALGIEMRVGLQLERAIATPASVGLELREADPIEVDLLVVAIGVKPRDELARESGIECDRRGGVIVDDSLCSSDPHVLAIGECVAHRGVQYGLVAPGYAMAEVVARRIAGDSEATFEGVPFSARLELEGIELSMIGESEAGDADSQAFTVARRSHYRRLLLRGGAIIGATAVGAWAALPRIQEAIARGERVSDRRLRRFERTSELWSSSEVRPLTEWPDAATVCSCTGVTCGTLRRARAEGLTTPAQLAQRTGASTVCGSCSPLIAELCGVRSLERPRPQRALLLGSIGALVLAVCVVYLSPVALSESVRTASLVEPLWRESWLRQITGFSIVGLVLASLSLSLRKRLARVSFGSFTGWRGAHAWLGTGALGLAALHTGLHVGERLNLALMTSFLALALLGAGAGIATSLERRLRPEWGGRLRRASTLAHVVVLSPFAVLLGFHVFKVYYF